MAKYIGQRMIVGVLSLLVLVSIAFFLTRAIPGSPFAGGNTSKTVQTSIEAEHGLDQSWMTQYRQYMVSIFRGDFGMSYHKQGVSVNEVIKRAWPVTALIGVLAVLAAMVFGTLLGICQALSSRKIVRRGIFMGTILGTAIPSFVIGILSIWIFGIKLKILPVSGLNGPKNLVLPVLSLCAYPTGVVTRLMCNAFEQELKQDYVILARAKGMKTREIAIFHVLKNAWHPVLNYIGPGAAFLITGSFVIESIFTIPGLGREFVNSIANRDYTLILGLTVFMGTVVIVVNLLVDLISAWIDPRMRRWLR